MPALKTLLALAIVTSLAGESKCPLALAAQGRVNRCSCSCSCRCPIPGTCLWAGMYHRAHRAHLAPAPCCCPIPAGKGCFGGKVAFSFEYHQEKPPVLASVPRCAVPSGDHRVSSSGGGSGAKPCSLSWLELCFPAKIRFLQGRTTKSRCKRQQ